MDKPQRQPATDEPEGKERRRDWWATADTASKAVTLAYKLWELLDKVTNDQQ
ncbi:hypothetical protein ACIGXI_09105 [Kitasatospora aureofaciens]|uniref:hypothetical protein n=1 Tax=Kitasatospora aureofaciens TaxID=1894 RepID=UPI0037CAF451